MARKCPSVWRSSCSSNYCFLFQFSPTARSKIQAKQYNLTSVLNLNVEISAWTESNSDKSFRTLCFLIVFELLNALGSYFSIRMHWVVYFSPFLGCFFLVSGLPFPSSFIERLVCCSWAGSSVTFFDFDAALWQAHQVPVHLLFCSGKAPTSLFWR